MKLSAARHGTGRGRDGDTSDNIDNLSLGLLALAWLGSALAEVCQFENKTRSICEQDKTNIAII